MAEVEQGARKLHPRLRMVKNGDRLVNAARSEATTTVACSASTHSVPPATPMLTAAQVAPVGKAARPVGDALRAPPPRSKLRDQPSANDSFVNVFIEFLHEPLGQKDSQPAEMQRVAVACAEQLKAGPTIPGAVIRRRNMVSATIPVTMLDELERNDAIGFIHRAEPLKLEVPSPTTALSPEDKSVGKPDQHGRGKGVLIGIIDVGGFDFAHEDFLDNEGKTRFVAIWDQGGDLRDAPAPFNYGSELKKPMLDAAIAASKKVGVPAVMLEPQSQMQPHSHGTHVASIAAGNTGVCPMADIAAVLVHIPGDKDPIEQRRTTFSDTSRIIHAVEYLLSIAGDRPVSINISLGTNGGSHDGASGVSRWLDAYLASPGRAICVAAGNAGQEAPESDDDLGWMMGRIHTSGRVPSRGLEVELEWTVVGNGVEDWSENELEIWYPAQDRLIAAIRPPGSREWIEVAPKEFVQNRQLPSGTIVSIYNELYHPTNGANYIAVYLSPNLDARNYKGIDAGVWRVRLKGDEIRDGRFNAWIERDDPVEIGRREGRRLFRFPSFFSSRTNVDSHSISSLACGHRIIAVANLDDARQRINASSSQGPTRDGRCKPEIAARGTDVVAAGGFAPEAPWASMTGTSMASPYVAGVVGLMLAADGTLTSAQCAGILQRTARPLPGAGYDWTNDVGYGRIDAERAVEEARTFSARTEL